MAAGTHYGNWVPRGAVVISAVVSVVLAVFSLVGWCVQSVTALQWVPDSQLVAFNAALCMLVAGAGLMGTLWGRRYLAIGTGIFMILVGLVTFTQQVSGTYLGIDQIFIRFLIPYSILPNKMAPNAAFCFTLTGISLCILNVPAQFSWKLPIVSFLGAMIVGLGTVSLLGFMSGVEAASRWGTMTQMAIQTSGVMALLGVGIVALAWEKEVAHDSVFMDEISKSLHWTSVPPPLPLITYVLPRWIPFPFAVALLTMTVALWQALNTEMQSADVTTTLSEKVLGGGLAFTVLLMLGVRLAQKAQRGAQLLQASTKQLADMRAALNSSSIISITDVHGTITYANDNFCEISKYSREELLGQNHRLIKSDIHPKEYYADMWRTIARGKVWKGEFCNKAKDGSFYWVYATIFPFLGANGKPESYMGIRHDITHMKEVEAALAEKAEELQRSNRALEEFDHVVAHELKSPLTVIKMAAENMVGADIGPLNPSQEDMLKMIDKSVDHLASIINNLLKMAQQSVSGNGLEVRNLNVKRHAGHVFQGLQGIAQKKNVVISDEISEDIPHVKSSPEVFVEVLTNLVGNAIRYASREVVVTAKHAQGMVQIEVRDDGPGIPKERLAYLFEKFVSDNKPQTSLFKGSGLGLYISKDLVTQMGGEIWAESEEGKGSSFYFSLPMDDSK